jgi:hypothetical protein
VKSIWRTHTNEPDNDQELCEEYDLSIGAWVCYDTAADPEMLDVAEEDEEILLYCHIVPKPRLAAAISKLLEYQTITVCTFESKKFAFAFLFVSRQFYTYTCRCTCKIGMKRGHVTTPTLNPKR